MPDTSDKPIFTFKDMKDSMESFSGNEKKDVLKWIKVFEDMSAFLDLGHLRKLICPK